MQTNNKQREALEHVKKLAREFAVGNYYVSDFPKMLLDAIQPALAEPPEPIGNNAEMRKALETVLDELLARSPNILIRKIETPPWVVELGVIIATALNAPSRNCDKFSKAEVLKLLNDRSFSKEDTIEWLYTEADGSHLF